jgi:hypothetical protein
MRRKDKEGKHRICTLVEVNKYWYIEGVSDDTEDRVMFETMT